MRLHRAGDSRLGLHVQDELVEVSALFNAGGFHTIAHLEHRGVNRVDRDTADLGVILLVHLGWHITAATLRR